MLENETLWETLLFQVNLTEDVDVLGTMAVLITLGKEAGSFMKSVTIETFEKLRTSPTWTTIQECVNWTIPSAS